MQLTPTVPDRFRPGDRPALVVSAGREIGRMFVPAPGQAGADVVIADIVGGLDIARCGAGVE